MKAFTRWLAGLFIPDAEQLQDPGVRAQYGLLEGWLSIFLNFLLFAIKLVVGILANSLALIADALHSLSDSATSVVVIIGFKISSKPPDPEHPYGHGRAEYIATLIISILLIVAGIEFIRSAIRQIIEPEVIRAGLWVLLVVFMTILAKELMGRVSKIMGELITSDTLQADAWHHRSDAISSVLVLISLVGGMLGIHSLDGFGGLGVAAILIYSGIRIARNAIDSLLGTPPTKELIERIRSLACSVDQVIDVHDITVHSYGQHRYINLHIEVSEREDPIMLHDIAEQVENRLYQDLNAYALVHLDPISVDSEEVRQLRMLMDDLCRTEEHLHSYHELRVVDSEHHHLAIMDLMLQHGLSDEETEQVLDRLRQHLHQQFPEIEFRFRLTPIHRYK
ncbi:MAG TPA: cation diffusion facilitator family transporter [bacterium]|nr:cation diffusion facilitator family transporter [bacterium]